MFEEHGLGYYGAEAAATCKTGGGREEMDEKDHEIAHFRIVARNRKLADFRANADSGEDDHRFRFDPDHLFRRQADQGRSEATLA
jgi:hypothetical protein